MKLLRYRLSTLVFALTCLVPGAGAQPLYGPGSAYWGYVPYPGVYGCSPAPCPLPGETRRDLRRELRQEGLRQQPAQPPAEAFELPRTPPVPTRSEEIRPEFQGASQIRDEYRRSGETR